MTIFVYRAFPFFLHEFQHYFEANNNKLPMRKKIINASNFFKVKEIVFTAKIYKKITLTLTRVSIQVSGTKLTERSFVNSTMANSVIYSKG